MLQLDWKRDVQTRSDVESTELLPQKHDKNMQRCHSMRDNNWFTKNIC